MSLARGLALEGWCGELGNNEYSSEFLIQIIALTHT